jgi:signal transduction histidine kinase
MIAESARLDRSADPARLRDAIDGLCRWLEQASNEGRAALQALRSPAEQRNDLVEAIRRMAEISEVASTMSFVLTAEGTQRELHPLVRDEVYRIVCEAIRNALRHSGASQMQVLLRYSRNFTATIKDNGRGIPEEIVDAGRPGHFGLQGMQERACRIHGKLRVSSRPNVGTEVDLIVPGSAIFVRPSAGSGSFSARLRELFQRKGF